MKDHIQSLILTPSLFEFPFSDSSEKHHPLLNPSGTQAQESTTIVKGTGVWDHLRKVLLYLQPHRPQRNLPEDIYYYLKHFIGSLDHGTELTIDSQFNHTLIPNFACSLAFLDPGWQAFGSTLRSLTLKGDVSLLVCVLEESVQLVKLDSLSVDIGRNKYGVDVEAAFSAFVWFIARHSGTLSALEIVSGDVVDFNWFSRGLERLPRLRRLKVQQPPSKEQSQCFAVQQFLLRHSDLITDLKWGYADAFLPHKDDGAQRTNDNTTIQTPFKITFSNIQQFSVSGSCPGSVHLNQALSFVERHQNILTNISFASWMLSLQDFALLTQAAASPVMKELDVGVELLTSRVFATLAAQFPSLEVLGLLYHKTGRMLAALSTRDSTLPITIAENLDTIHFVHGFVEFEEDMEALSLGAWPVEALNIRRYACSERQKYRVESVGKVIVAGLPKIGFVNGMYKDQFISNYHGMR
ncbi:hypothetical protein D9756_003541 [Leucocoprinus leucothites]|uniref:Uncharacterized protein n=1 Tax=Leucocoprinus leucothites TaxID=201217 RepID=A0A8H5G6Q9_9AGAR|nr:hypothetical protein D9756_003541 [Leucoagaricus leucothites]